MTLFAWKALRFVFIITITVSSKSGRFTNWFFFSKKILCFLFFVRRRFFVLSLVCIIIIDSHLPLKLDTFKHFAFQHYACFEFHNHFCSCFSMAKAYQVFSYSKRALKYERTFKFFFLKYNNDEILLFLRDLNVSEWVEKKFLENNNCNTNIILVSFIEFPIHIRKV